MLLSTSPNSRRLEFEGVRGRASSSSSSSSGSPPRSSSFSVKSPSSPLFSIFPKTPSSSPSSSTQEIILSPTNPTLAPTSTSTPTSNPLPPKNYHKNYNVYEDFPAGKESLMKRRNSALFVESEMGEFLKIWNDLGQMSKTLPIGVLQHHFEGYEPSEVKFLEESITHFHMTDLEASDYRSAYHQFSDWLYGWSVSDDSEQNQSGGKGGRVPREIVIANEREFADAQRLMKTFETLCGLSLRHLKVCYSSIEAEMPRIGQGLDTFSNIHRIDEEELQVDLTNQDTNILEKVWGNKFAEDSDENKDGMLGSTNELVEGEDNLENEPDFPAILIEKEIAPPVTPPEFNESLMMIDRQPSQMGLFEIQPGESYDDGDKSSLKGSFMFLAKSADSQGSTASVAAAAAAAAGTAGGAPGIEKEESKSGSVTPDELPPATEAQETPIPDFISTPDATLKALQRDVNHVFREVDESADYTMISMCSIAAILAFSEMLGDKDTFKKASIWAHDLSKDFISNTLKTVWDLLNKEIPAKTTLAGLRSPTEFKALIHQLISLRSVNGVAPKLRMRKLHHKFAAIHLFFTLCDIHIFPNFAVVHKEGLKCAQYSAFDSYLWLTGGYDCIIRITDIRAQNKHMCLAQYVGHKSIVTDAHFTHDDANIVSCSYDRTIKIWNSRTAVADKTLSGHTDAITSCHVSCDGRYIASGSLDNSIRFWDFNTGECITVVKKHTRWVKMVRFSPDGRYLASAGMDRKIYIWETKILANSRSPSHSRLLDNFNDYVLDMVLFKPSFLLASSRDSVIRLFDYVNGHDLRSISLAPSWACSISLSQNGEYFATGSFDNNINIYRVKDFVRVREIRVFNLGILCVRFPTDLSYLLVGTAEGFMQQVTL